MEGQERRGTKLPENSARGRRTPAEKPQTPATTRNARADAQQAGNICTPSHAPLADPPSHFRAPTSCCLARWYAAALDPLSSTSSPAVSNSSLKQYTRTWHWGRTPSGRRAAHARTKCGHGRSGDNVSRVSVCVSGGGERSHTRGERAGRNGQWRGMRKHAGVGAWGRRATHQAEGVLRNVVVVHCGGEVTLGLAERRPPLAQLLRTNTHAHAKLAARATQAVEGEAPLASLSPARAYRPRRHSVPARPRPLP